MAEVLVQNMRNPDEVISVMVTLKQMIIATDGSMDRKWVLEASTNSTDANGDLVYPEVMYLSNRDTLSDDIQDLISNLCAKVGWTYEPDYDPPQIIGHWPLADDDNVPVTTDIVINLAEPPPSAGIDLSSIKLTVKGFDLTDQATIKGDIHSCSIVVTPGTRYQSAVDSNVDWSSIDVY